MEEKLLNRYLKHLYEAYTKEHGVSLRMLKRHKFSIVEAAVSYEVPGMVECSEDGEIQKNNAAEVVAELAHRGWVETDSLWFWLTESGVDKAGISRVKGVLNYVNANPWIATAIAVLALVVSVFGALPATNA